MSELSKDDKVSMNNLSRDSFEMHYDFLKKILTVSVSVLGIIVALGSTLGNQRIDSSYTFLTYSLALSTLGLGILCVSVCLFGFVAARRRLADEYAGEMSKKMKNAAFSPVSRDNSPKVYTYAERAGFVLLSLSVISFTVYAILIVL